MKKPRPLDLNRLEKTRKYVIVIKLFGYFLWLATVIVWIFVFSGYGFIIMIAAALYPIFYDYIKKVYARRYNEYFVTDIIKKHFTDLYIAPRKGIAKNIIYNTNIVKHGNRYRSDNYVSGKYNGVNFEQADVCIQNLELCGRTVQVIPYFKGRWMIFDYNKPFTTKINIAEKFTYSMYAGNKMEVEDEAFNQEFFAYDEHEAYYILMPQVM